MGDSTCLMQPFCYASGISNEANESNPIHALGQSISFGRFMSESLSWEKWSSFSHNRYVEEAERYSRPGSVAQKKAFFEAHYKKLAAQKAAALLEQANNAAAPSENATNQENQEPPHNNTHEQDEDVKVLNSTKVDQAEQETESQAFVDSPMKPELQNQLEDDVVDTHKDASQEKFSETTPVDTTSVLEQSATNSDSKKKPPTSSSKMLNADVSVSTKLNSTPAKPTFPISHYKDNIMGTPLSNMPADKKRTTPKSLHKSVNFTPIRELNRLTASVMRRFENARVGAASSSKASKECSSTTPLRTPTMASKNELHKYPSMTPLTEKKRSKTPLGSSAMGSNTTGPKWSLLSTENKMRSPVISSPFSLRTEERAERRKKKLEEKFNATNEATKVQLHTKLREKAETEIRKLRQSFCFKARPLPDFYKERKVSKNETNKILFSESPKQGRKCSPSVVGSKTSVTPQSQRLWVKSNGTKNFFGKNGESSTHPVSTNSRMIRHENTSPNIQHGNQNDRNYKNFTQRLEQSITRQCQSGWQKNLYDRK